MSNKRKQIEKANKRLLGEGVDIKNTSMFHCDAKLCEHYKDEDGTTNCLLEQISVSAKGGCNQYEPKKKGD
ncbi:MAG: hypothetical protein GTO02_02620 [Candidatus Dadabacteria bacterium]|nr:hypothetical protein [Candidatus Dadabacteria bacterium]